MPELIEVEYYRAALEPLVGSTVNEIIIPNARYVRPADTPVQVFDQLIGARLVSVGRRGKLLLAQFTDDFVVGLRFGMTGRLLIDGAGPIESLEYSSSRNDPAWDRAILVLDDTRVSVRDQRRLGSIELDPRTDDLGTEASTIQGTELRAALLGRRKPIKTALLDQHLIAGLGNLLVDEILWRVGIAPSRSSSELADDEIETLAEAIPATVAHLTKRGGSHRGDSFEVRTPGATCPRCGGAMGRSLIGGRSSWWCASHQM
ncbi:MAG: formamidopyrimidine-DNA glycosylase [Verrucomicrobiales bacterium]